MISFSNTIFLKKISVIVRLSIRAYLIFSVIPLFSSEVKEFSSKDVYKLTGSILGVYIADIALRKACRYSPVEIHKTTPINPKASATDAATYTFRKIIEEERISQKTIFQTIAEPSLSISSNTKVKFNLVSIAIYSAAGFLGWQIGKSYE